MALAIFTFLGILNDAETESLDIKINKLLQLLFLPNSIIIYLFQVIQFIFNHFKSYYLCIGNFNLGVLIICSHSSWRKHIKKQRRKWKRQAQARILNDRK